jgi:hypothetical protein
LAWRDDDRGFANEARVHEPDSDTQTSGSLLCQDREQ